MSKPAATGILPSREEQELDVAFNLLALMQQMRLAQPSFTQPVVSVPPARPCVSIRSESPRGDAEDCAFEFAATRNRLAAAFPAPK